MAKCGSAPVRQPAAILLSFRFRGSALPRFHRDDFTSTMSLGVVKGGQLNRALFQHNLIGDRVTTIDRFCPMTDHRHRGRARHSRALQIAHRGASEVMRNALRHAGALTGRFPCSAEIPDRDSVAMEEPRDDSSRSLVQAPLVFSICHSRTSRRSGVSGKFRPSPFLVSPGSSRSHPASQIDVMLLAGEDFRRDPPSGDVRCLNNRLQFFRQMLKRRARYSSASKKAFAPIVFPKHRDFRPLDDFADFLA